MMTASVTAEEPFVDEGGMRVIVRFETRETVDVGTGRLSEPRISHVVVFRIFMLDGQSPIRAQRRIVAFRDSLWPNLVNALYGARTQRALAPHQPSSLKACSSFSMKYIARMSFLAAATMATFSP